MKKLVVLGVFAVAFAFTSCTGCDRKNDPAQGEPSDVVQDPVVDAVEDPAAATPATEVALDTVKSEVKTETKTTEIKK